MLDKSIPYVHINMIRKSGTPIPNYPLPDGFRFVLYKDGDEADWARIETSVDEFDNESEALMRFQRDFLPYKDELYRRLLFIEDPNGKKVATANAWWSIVNSERRSWVHWVSVAPECQGSGLGKAISAQVVKLLTDIDGDTNIWLSTQTWSYKAINIYKQCGFEPTDEEILYVNTSKREYRKGLKILKQQGVVF